MKKDTLFGRFARFVSFATGSPYAFVLALGIIIVWGVTGPIFGFSDTWQLVINTGTTIVTFLMVFIIQHSQNKDTMALQLKLDELIRTAKEADDRLMDLEELSDKELEEAHRNFLMMAEKARDKQDARDKEKKKP